MQSILQLSISSTKQVKRRLLSIPLIRWLTFGVLGFFYSPNGEVIKWKRIMALFFAILMAIAVLDMSFLGSGSDSSSFQSDSLEVHRGPKIAFITYAFIERPEKFIKLISRALGTFLAQEATYFVVMTPQWKQNFADLCESDDSPLDCSRVTPIWVDCLEESAQASSCKVERGLAQVWGRYEEEYDWFLYMDDDEILNTSTIKSYLSVMDPLDAFVVGSSEPRPLGSSYSCPAKCSYNCSMDDPSFRYMWGQPVIYSKAAMKRVMSGFRMGGMVSTCAAYSVFHDLGLGVYNWMYSLPALRVDMTQLATENGETLPQRTPKQKVNGYYRGSSGGGKHATKKDAGVPPKLEFRWHNVTGFQKTRTFEKFGDPAAWSQRWRHPRSPDCFPIGEGPVDLPPVRSTKPSTAKKTNSPTVKATSNPTARATDPPTTKATDSPTAKPTVSPTMKPTDSPTLKPTASPTIKPTESPTRTPEEKTSTHSPTAKPTDRPTVKPTASPPTSNEKSSDNPTSKNTAKPTSTEPQSSDSKPATEKEKAEVEKGQDKSTNSGKDKSTDSGKDKPVESNSTNDKEKSTILTTTKQKSEGSSSTKAYNKSTGASSERNEEKAASAKESENAKNSNPKKEKEPSSGSSSTKDKEKSMGSSSTKDKESIDSSSTNDKTKSTDSNSTISKKKSIDSSSVKDDAKSKGSSSANDGNEAMDANRSKDKERLNEKADSKSVKFDKPSAEDNLADTIQEAKKSSKDTAFEGKLFKDEPTNGEFTGKSKSTDASLNTDKSMDDLFEKDGTLDAGGTPAPTVKLVSKTKLKNSTSTKEGSETSRVNVKTSNGPPSAKKKRVITMDRIAGKG